MLSRNSMLKIVTRLRHGDEQGTIVHYAKYNIRFFLTRYLLDGSGIGDHITRGIQVAMMASVILKPDNLMEIGIPGHQPPAVTHFIGTGAVGPDTGGNSDIGVALLTCAL